MRFSPIILALFLFFFTASCSGYEEEGPNRYFLKDVLRKSVCRGISDESPCKIPYPLSERLSGVCCLGRCFFGAETCGDKEPTPYDPVEVFSHSVCLEVEEGGRCEVPDVIKQSGDDRLYGTCCQGLCRWGIKGCISYCGDGFCTEREMAEGNCMQDCSVKDHRKDVDFDALMEEMVLLSCLGSEDGEECSLPKDLEREFGLSGVCCKGKCRYRRDTCDEFLERKPDLIVTSIKVIPEDPAEDEKVSVTVSLKNVGEAPVSELFWVLLKIIDAGDLFAEENRQVGNSLGVSEEVKVTYEEKLGLGRSGSFRLVAEVDRNSNYKHQDDLVDEVDEENNQGEMLLFVKPKDEAGRSKSEVDDCGDGFCSERERRMDNCIQDCRIAEADPVEADGPPILFLASVLSALLAVVAFTVFLLRSKKRFYGQDAGPKSVSDLQREKEAIENMMKLAKSKYHRRELDEESFREIIRDNQKKVIEIELKIKAFEP